MRILTFTTLYPNAARPNFGVFVENRLRQLVSGGEVQARVVAPVPWFPFRSDAFGDWAKWAQAPRRETRHGIEVDHPRYLLPPRVGMNVQPLLLFAAVRPYLDQLIADGFRFDLIDAHYFYPDGVAAALLARHYRKPFAITGRGSDLALLPKFPLPRRMIRWAAARASALITVSAGLRDELAGLGVPRERVRVLRNGVDLTLFRPVERAAARARLGFDRPTLLFVGNLIPLKRQEVAIRALALLPQARLVLAGEGPDRERLQRLAVEFGVGDRIAFLGTVPHDALPDIYGAADLLLLLSEREGWPNVLLEAMACGTPVLAAAVGGIPEVVGSPAAGRLLDEVTPPAVAAAAGALLAAPPSRSATRAYAEGFGWDATSRGLTELFRDVLRHPQRSGALHAAA